MLTASFASLIKSTSELSLKTASLFSRFSTTSANRTTNQNGINSLKLLPYTSVPTLFSSNTLLNPSRVLNDTQIVQSRFNWGYKGRMMLKDIKRREMLRKLAPIRIRLQALRANSILPKVLKRDAEEELQGLTRHSTMKFVTNRCGFTSKAGGCLHRWRLSRHVWRDQVDYNQMSGVTKATWGIPTKSAAHFTFKQAKRNWFNFDGYRSISFINKQGETRRMRFKLN